MAYDGPMFEIASNPRMAMEDIRLFKAGEITWDDLLSRAVDDANPGKVVSKATAAALVCIGMNIDPKTLKLRYAAEYRKADAAGQASCGQLNKGHWARCSRPEGHEDEHAALDPETLKVVEAWEA
jgi:hypothetical protein